MAYRYKAIDISGRVVEDVVKANSVIDATEDLRRRGLFVTEIKDFTERPGKQRTGSRFGSGGRLVLVAAFLRQLSVLLASGTPLVQALAALERQTTSLTFRDVVRQLRDEVEQGDQLSEAMARRPHYFDGVCRGLVSAGESGGDLNSILTRLAGMVRRQVQIRSTIIGAMVYPCLLLVVSLAVVVLMLVFVLPRFAGMFETLGTEMPFTTKALLQTSGWITHYWWMVLLGIGAVGFVVWQWLRTDRGTQFLHTAAVKLPLSGKVVRAFCVARMARVLGMLLASKVPLNDALKLTQNVAGNQRFVEAMVAAEEAVTRGSSLSGALSDSGLVSPSVCEAVRSGEQTGKLGELLIMVADFMDEENETILKSVTSLIEPAILICVGLFVGVVVLSMFMPLFDVAASAGGGS